MSEAAVRRRLAKDERVVAVLDGDRGGEAYVDLRPLDPRSVEVRHLDAAGRLVRLLYLEEGGRRLVVRQTLHRHFGGSGEALRRGSLGVVMPDGRGLGWLLDVDRGKVRSMRGPVVAALPVTLRFPDDADLISLTLLADIDVDISRLPEEVPFAAPPATEETASLLGGAPPPLPPMSTVPRPLAPIFPWLWFFGGNEDLTDRLIEVFPEEAAALSFLTGLVEPELEAWIAAARHDPRARAAETALHQLLFA